jgi:hypothetical protein
VVAGRTSEHVVTVSTDPDALQIRVIRPLHL